VSSSLKSLDSGLRRNDESGLIQHFLKATAVQKFESAKIWSRDHRKPDCRSKPATEFISAKSLDLIFRSPVDGLSKAIPVNGPLVRKPNIYSIDLLICQNNSNPSRNVADELD